MKIKFIIFILFKLVKLNTDLFESLSRFNIKENTAFNNILNMNRLNAIDPIIIEKIFNFININTNVTQANKFNELFMCANSMIDDSRGNKNYLNTLAYSGKDLTDLGLEEECLRSNFSYFLLVYEFEKGFFEEFENENNSFVFFQQNTFFTGICLPKICNPILKFLFNETEDPNLYNFLRNDFNVQNVRIYEVGRLNKVSERKRPIISYDSDGKYNEDRTESERKKYLIFYIFLGIVFTLLSIQIIVGIIFYVFCRTFDKTREYQKEKEIEDNMSDSSNETSPQLFENIQQKEEKQIKCCDNPLTRFFHDYLSLFKNIKFLLKKKNRYYDSNNLGVITYFRIIAMILITFINNFEVLIKIPSKYFFYENYYIDYSTVFLKFSSFSVDAWICLDGFEMMYKLVTFYKKYIYDNKDNKCFSYLLLFFLSSLYKFISFFIFFFIVNYLNKYFIYVLTEGPLFEYYSNHIYNNNLNDSSLFRFLIPGYSIYLSYKNKCSIYINLFISKFSLLLINEFYAYILLLLFFYFSVLIKSSIFDYIILVINFGLYIANYWIIELGENQYYSYKLVFDNFFTYRYPHIIFNFFFLGAMAALICFYYKDSFLSNSICNEQNKYPFKFCYKSIIFFDFLMQKGRKFWVYFFFVIQIIISLSFYFLVLLNDNKINISLNVLQKIVACYESGLFVFLFCIIIILIIFIRSENEVRQVNKSSIIYLIERTNFSFFHTINLLMYTFYCFFYFQVKFNMQNLFIVTFGLFFVVCFENTILTLIFVHPLKVANKRIIKMFLKDNNKDIRFSQPSLDLEKPLVRNTVGSVTTI